MESYRIYFATIGSEYPIWDLYLNNLELIAGMLAVGLPIIDELNSESDMQYYMDTDADVSEFRLAENIPESRLQSVSNNKLYENEFAMWLKGTERFKYNLYRFKTSKFFQGIVSVCDTFQVDFRNYLYGFPFDKYGNQYAFSNYIMAPYQIGTDTIDVDDIEEEEEWDENINNPLERTDDIINVPDPNSWFVEMIY